MAVNDIRSNLKQTVAVTQAVTTSTTDINGTPIDTANYELGLMFSLSVPVLSAGTLAVELFESDTELTTVNTGTPILNGSEKLIGTLPTAAAATPTGEGDDLLTVGVISNLRYVRAQVVTTASTGTFTVLATQKAEVMPV